MKGILKRIIAFLLVILLVIGNTFSGSRMIVYADSDESTNDDDSGLKDDDGFAFNADLQDSYTYSASLTQTGIDVSAQSTKEDDADRTIEYSITSQQNPDDSDVGAENPIVELSTDAENATAKVIVNRAGSFTVTAKISAGNIYKEKTIEKTIRISKAEQNDFKFEQNQYEFTVGSDNVVSDNAVVKAAGGETTGEIEYSIVTDENNIIASISSDDEGGKITFKDGVTSGSATIKAVKAGDDCYKDAEATCTVTLKWADSGETTEPAVEPTITISVEFSDGSKEYTGISEQTDVVYSNKGSIGINYTDADNWTLKYVVIDYSEDEGLPDEQKLNGIEDGKFNDIPKNSENNEFRIDSIDNKITPQIIVVKAVNDNDEENIIFVTSQPIIFDSEEPIVEINLSDEIYLEDDIKYYNDIPELSVKVSDNLGNDTDNGIASAVYSIVADDTTIVENVNLALNVNSVLDDNSDTDSVTDSVTINLNDYEDKLKDKIVTLTVVAVDKAGNKTAETVKFFVDSTKPDVDITYDVTDSKGTIGSDKSPLEKDTEIYNSKLTMTVTVTEKNFSASDVDINIQAKDKNGNDIEITEPSFTWNNDSDNADVYNAEYTFEKDGYYIVTVNVKDKVGNPSETKTSAFLIDKTLPFGNISIDATSWDDIIADADITSGIIAIYVKQGTVSYDNFGDDMGPLKSIGYIIKKYDDIDSYKNDGLTDKEEITKSEYSGWNLVDDNLSGKGEINLNDSTNSESADGIYIVYFKLTDQADNTKYLSTGAIAVDNTSAVIEVQDSSEIKYTNDSKVPCYAGSLEMELSYDEKFFEPGTAIDGITIKKINNGTEEPLNKSEYISEDKFSRADTGEYKASLKISEKGEYVIIFTYTDKVGNTAEKIEKHFIVDNEKPTGSISMNDSVSWDELITTDELKDELYYNTDVVLQYSATDSLTGIKQVSYWADTKADGSIISEAYTADKLDAFSSDLWSVVDAEKGEIQLSDEGSYIVYFKLEDNVGNVTYLSTDRIVIDKTEPNVHNIKVNDTVYGDYSGSLSSVELKDDILIEIEGGDAVSSTVNEYYISDSVTVLTDGELSSIESWTEYTSPVTISDEGRHTVYARFTDKAGNRTYAHSAAYIIDKTAPDLEVSIENANENNLYSGDVKINFSVEDKGIYSGIKKIEYDIYVDEEKKDTVVVYENSADTSVYENLVATVNNSYVINGKTYNFDNIRLVTRVIDTAGNTQEVETSFDINSTLPAIEYSYSGTEFTRINDKDGYGYYKDSRKLEVVITCRTSSFEEDKATDGIVITCNGKPYDIEDKLSGWTTVDDINNPDKAKHIATVILDAEGKYEVGINYTDKAGNTAESITTSSASPEKFVIDRKAPTGNITVEGVDNKFASLIDIIHFGIWMNKKAAITADVADNLSPIYSISYYKTSDKIAKTLDELNSVKWTTFAPFTVESDDTYVVYLRIEDYAGNVSYICTDGIIADFRSPAFEKVAPEISINPEFVNCDVYDGDVTVDIAVSDPVENNSYSGLKSVRYEVKNSGEKTQDGQIYTFTNDNPVYEDIVQKIEKSIVVKADKNNGNNIEVIVYATDNAGNESSSSITIKIDTVNPEGSIALGEYTWNTVQDNVKYDIYLKKDAVLKYNTSDAVSGVKSVAYKVSKTQRDEQTTTILTEKELEELDESEWTYFAQEKMESGEIALKEDGAYIVYFKIMDKVGHVAYMSTNCIVVDKTKPYKHNIKVDETDYEDYAQQLKFIESNAAGITIQLEGEDTVSDTLIEYYISDSTECLTERELLSAKWTEFTDKITITNEGRYTVYARFTDKSGNSVYAHSAAYIIDRTAPEFTAVIDNANNLNLYSGSVKINVNAEDRGKYSGIKKIDYDIFVDNEYKETVTVYENNADNSVYGNLVNKVDTSYVIDGKKYNHDNIHIITRVTDTVGNTASRDIYFDINSTIPVINYEYSGTKLTRINPADGYGYYSGSRTLTVNITCRTSVFEADKATEGITVKLDGKAYDITDRISQWTTVEDENEPDKAVHTAQITLDEEGYYTVSFTYTDKSGNKASSISSTSDTPEKFVIDKTKPSGSITVENVGIFKTLVNTLHFRIWLNKAATITADVSDLISPIYKISYYRTAAVRALTQKQLDTVEEWQDFAPFTIVDDGRYTVYLKIEDYAGNVRYISTDGIITDFTLVKVEKIAPEISVNPEFADCGVYDGDVNIEITVSDPVVNNSYSGVNSVKYEVWNDDVKTQDEQIYTFNNDNPIYEEIEQEITKNIVVKADENNGNNIKVIVYAADNAGNKSSSSITIKIDTVNPKGNIALGEYTWNTVQNSVKYDIYLKKDAVLSYNTSDAVSGIKSVAYKVSRTQRDTQTTAVLTENELSVLDESEWTYVASEKMKSGEVAITEDGAYIVYFKVTDKVGHVIYMSTNCIVVDKTVPNIHSIKINGNVYSDYSDKLDFVEDKFENINIEIDGQDEVSSTAIKYFITDSTEYIKKEQLANVEWTDYTGAFSISEEGRYTIYACYTDKSGNSIYAHSAAYIVDRTAPVFTNVIKDSNEFNLYSGNVTLHVEATDEGKYSGIKKIDYDIYTGGNYRETVTVYENTLDKSVYGNLINNKSADYVIDGLKYNCDNIHIVTRVTDTAGNTSSTDTYFDINSTHPVIDYSYSGAELKRINGENEYGYYPDSRIMTVDITCRTTNFEPDKATAGIVILHDGEAYDVAGRISQWSTVENADDPDAAHHIATIVLDEEGHYDVSCNYTDKAGNEASQINSVSDTPNKFVVDRTKPTGSISVGGVGTYSSLIGILNFGIWLNSAVSVSADAQDEIGPIYEISYIKTPSVYAFTSAQLDGMGGWEIFRPFTVSSNERYTIYIRIEDYAGNVQYISTNGIISDSISPIVEDIEPEISIVPEFTESGIYSDDVTVNINVSDPETNGSYSGLKRVSYEVFNMGVVTQSEVLLDYGISNPSWDELVQQINQTITIDAELNNSNDVRLVVYAIDNSGNDVEEELELKIDVSEPEIVVSYDNNDAVTEYTDVAFFKEQRRATIEILERNFDPSKVEVVITNSDGAIPAISGWTVVDGTGNLDDTRNIAYIDYSSDGDYTFEIKCKDAAGNESEDVDYGNSLSPEEFTVDLTEPVLNVSFDNNDSANELYYNTERTAVFEINEHNFDPSKAVVTITASDDGSAIDAPSLGNWTGNGDVHSMSVAFTQDGDYKLSVEYADMAGNELIQVYETEFVVDLTAPVVEITGVEDMSANNGDVMPVITLSDTNISFDDIRLTLVGANRGEVELDGKYTDIHNGRVFTFNNFADEKEVDDIYTLTARAVDRAGNETVSEVMFSVNRFGSTYIFSENTRALLGKFIKDEEDIVITEINPNELTESELTLFKNNETIVLEKDKDYSVDMDGGDGKWYSYTYTIFKENFADDGVYRISVYSKDRARNTSENSLEDKGAEISFGVDKTLPNIIISGVESDKTYAEESKDVIITASDNLKLSELVVTLNGAEYRRWGTDEIDEMIAANDDFVVSVGESNRAQQLVVTAYDAAGNEMTQTVDNFYVTTNEWIRFYNNKIAFFGSIGGSVTLLGGGGYLGFFLRRRKLLKLMTK